MKSAATKSLLLLVLGLNIAMAAPVAKPMAQVTPVVVAPTLAYNAELLISRYASWGIDPDKHLASINLKDSWFKFKKNKDIVVAVIDTGIQGDHAFLADNI